MNPLLYFNGDSFVQGAELGDDILPDHPGYLSYNSSTNERDVKKQWRASIPPSSDEIIRLELSRNFSSKVAEITGLKYINHALGGASMDSIVRSTLRDLIELKNDNRVIAFIGTTEPFRAEFASSESEHVDMHGYYNDWQTIGLWESNNDDPISAIRKYKVMYEHDYHRMVNFYKNVIVLQDFCKLHNIDLYWIKPLPSIIEVTDKYSSRPDLLNFKQYANIQYSFDFSKVVEDNRDKLLICPGGHYNKLAHDMFAEQIANFIKIVYGELNV